MRIAACVFAIALLVTPAVAQTDPASQQPEQPAAVVPAPPEAETGQPDPDEEVICRWVESSTETRLRRHRTRMCATRTQWEIMADESRRSVIGLGSVQGRRD